MQSASNYQKQFDEAFFNDGYNICDTFIRVGLTAETLSLGLSEMYKSIDGFIETFLGAAEKQGAPTDCKRGCAYCCHQTVLASTYELVYLGYFLKKKYPGKALNKIVERVNDKAEKTSILKLDKLLKFKQPCPLLHSTGNFCMAYQARPMACRIYLSRNVQSCINDLDNPLNDSVFPELFDMPLRAGKMMNEGFQARLRKEVADKLQVFENTIEGGLQTVLNRFEVDNWLKGKKVFKKIET
ncbi:MAG: YkgJ family cysteine cluster protein [Prolixibacteraceae bacterium]|nr:YkgJ family cysteine cluster protein [Prolixibacteraceae bacterium]